MVCGGVCVVVTRDRFGGGIPFFMGGGGMPGGMPGGMGGGPEKEVRGDDCACLRCSTATWTGLGIRGAVLLGVVSSRVCCRCGVAVAAAACRDCIHLCNGC